MRSAAVVVEDVMAEAGALHRRGKSLAAGVRNTFTLPLSRRLSSEPRSRNCAWDARRSGRRRLCSGKPRPLEKEGAAFAASSAPGCLAAERPDQYPDASRATPFQHAVRLVGNAARRRGACSHWRTRAAERSRGSGGEWAATRIRTPAGEQLAPLQAAPVRECAAGLFRVARSPRRRLMLTSGA